MWRCQHQKNKKCRCYFYTDKNIEIFSGYKPESHTCFETFNSQTSSIMGTYLNSLAMGEDDPLQENSFDE